MTATAGARAVGLAAAAVLVACACAFWPLSTYAFTLALFGAPHALVEVRWVVRRYGAWRDAAMRTLVVLSAIALARLLAVRLGFTPATSSAVELGLGALLVACVLRVEGLRRSPARLVASVVVLALLVLGVAIAPVDAMLVLAIAHNLTPAGFVADRVRDGDVGSAARVQFAVVGLVVLVALPLWLASGAATATLGLASSTSTTADLGAASHLGLVPADGIAAFAPSFVAGDHTLDLLRAAAFLQVVHYVGVLVVLPRLRPLPLDAAQAQPKSSRTAFALLVGFLGLVFAMAFAVDFREAKAGYGVLAAVHVWLEFPALLLALAPRVGAPRPA